MKVKVVQFFLFGFDGGVISDNFHKIDFTDLIKKHFNLCYGIQFQIYAYLFIIVELNILGKNMNINN
jgi:hypothetical protein